MLGEGSYIALNIRDNIEKVAKYWWYLMDAESKYGGEILELLFFKKLGRKPLIGLEMKISFGRFIPIFFLHFL